MTDNTEALPPLPEKRWAGFCSKCHSTTQFQKRPNTKAAPCGRCGYATFCEELDYSDDEMRTYARAALAQRQQVPTTAWLVEWRFNGVQWLYLWPSAPGGFSFTSDASKALRFARREDAEAALQWARDTDAARRPIGSLTRHGLALGEMLVTEHDWPALTAATPTAQAEPQEPLPEFLTTQDKADLLRIEDCFSDGEGYDLPRERMARLAELGVIRHNGGGVYSITAFGMYCTGAWPVLPLKTAAESNAEAGRLHAERMAHGIGKQEGK